LKWGKLYKGVHQIELTPKDKNTTFLINGIQYSGKLTAYDIASKLFLVVEKDNRSIIEVDLSSQRITVAATGETESFDINPYKKECLLNGYDDIDYLLSLKDRIEEYEKLNS
jgi:3-isopropylmalate dehydratase small subunit